MVNMSYVKFLSGLLLVLAVCSMFEQTVAVQKFCGKALGEALDNLCVNGFNSKIKRSMLFDMDDSYNDIDDDLPYPYDNPLFMGKIHAGSMVSKNRRRRHGVYDECCRKGCTYTELIAYCL